MGEKELATLEEMLPDKLYIVPLAGKPIYPGILTPLMIVSPQDLSAVEKAMAKNGGMLGLVLLRDDETDSNAPVTPDDLYTVGTAAKIVKKINLPDGGLNIFVSTLKRFRIKEALTKRAPLAVEVEYLEDRKERSGSAEIKALTQAILSEMKQVSENNPLFTEEMRLNMVNIDQPGKIADFVASILNIDKKEQQKILETLNIRKRMEKVLVFIKKEQELLRIQKKIQKQINEKIEKSQRVYFLREELKAIKKELGLPADSKDSDYNRFREAVRKFGFTGEVKEAVEQELQKFSMMDPHSPEFGVTRNYLSTIINLPWNRFSDDKLDIRKAKAILSRDHYGLEDVKERIIEFLSVKKLKKDSKGSIICLVGPPGVGKTSVGRSVAKAMNREFFRFSVGGMKDEAEIKGHRRTYIGAMPGKILQGLKICKTSNPVFMIDEIDKLGSSYQGDPSSALLEVLDPEQNVSFRDHYLDLPFDISNVMFITTANSLDTIPTPLLDRMEIIRIAGYIKQEKVKIAERYLLPKSLEANGLDKEQVFYKGDTLSVIAENYVRESGVRNLEKALDKINRKLARELVMDKREYPFIITSDKLEKYLGKPRFAPDEIKVPTGPGMVVGLAWTNFGGDTLMIETARMPGKEGFRLTGQMGDVMKESANIAFTYVRTIAERFGIDRSAFEDYQYHLHIPEGATPKDGPSAGITMASAVLSLIRNRKIKKDFAMTGELSLTGAVLPIGGLKEKTIAARRNMIKHIIIPKQNEKDLEEIPAYVKKGIVFHPVSRMEEVIELIF